MTAFLAGPAGDHRQVLDVAVRDLDGLGAFVLTRRSEVRGEAPAYARAPRTSVG